jgi:shikimate dehydrogenase
MQVQHFEISGQTGLIGVFGHPVAHSLSPHMHNAAFKAQSVDMVYLAFDVLPERLASAVEGVRSLGMRGVNVTVPHKEKVIEFLDMIDPLATRIGAVNTVVNDQDRLCGYNTDVAGFLSALRSLLPGGSQGLRCLVAGAGGAARAVVAALSEEGAGEIWVHNRTFDRAEALCEAASGWGRSVCEAVADEDLTARVRAADLLVNATSVGLATSVKESALPVDIIDSHQVVMDVVYYGPRPTALLAAARAKGAAVLDGREMLVMQAASSYLLWTGLQPPIEIMRKSLDLLER